MGTSDLDWYVLVLAGRLGCEHVGDLSVRRGLPANGTFDGSPPGAHAVLLHNDRDALVAEAVAAGQNCPLEKGRRSRDGNERRHYGGNNAAVKGSAVQVAHIVQFPPLVPGAGHRWDTAQGSGLQWTCPGTEGVFVIWLMITPHSF